MRQRHQKHAVGPQHPVHLAKHPAEVVLPGHRVDRHAQVDAVRPDERQVGEIRLMEFHPNLGLVGQRSRAPQPGGGGLDRNHPGAGAGHGDGAGATADAQLEHPATLEVAEQALVVGVVEVGAELDQVGLLAQAVGKAGRR